MDDGNIMTPKPVGGEGQQAEAQNLSGGKGVPKEADGLKVVETKFEGGKLVVTIEGDNADKVMSVASRNLAYAQRFSFGMVNAGIEALAGMYVPEEEYKAAQADKSKQVSHWRRDFILTPSL